MIRSLTKFSIRENFYHSRATLVRWDRYYMVLEVYKLYTAVSHAHGMACMAWHPDQTNGPQLVATVMFHLVPFGTITSSIYRSWTVL